MAVELVGACLTGASALLNGRLPCRAGGAATQSSGTMLQCGPWWGLLDSVVTARLRQAGKILHS